MHGVVHGVAVAQGYNAFGVFGVSPTDINTTFKGLKEKGFAVGSLELSNPYRMEHANP